MTKETLKKIEGSAIKYALDYKKRMGKRFKERGLVKEAETMRANIVGYLQALRDFEIITESEREVLFIYYATM